MQIFFDNLTTSEFLRDYWQQKPLLVRQAFPNFDPIISPLELQKLAMQTDNARLVIHQPQRRPAWRVKYAPFSKADFTRLPAKNWSLLVNAAETLAPQLSTVIAPFRFLPDWRIDDLMISLAAPGGSVGPHVDEYDVFLIQGYGQRHWHISEQVVADDDYLPNIDLRIMRNFTSQQDWVLAPGDMLYLPPHIPHYGIAIDDCMTYSVGFRAPNAAELLEAWVQDLLDDATNYERFRDPKRLIQDHPAEISTTDIDGLYHLLINNLNNKDKFYCWIGEYLTKKIATPLSNTNNTQPIPPLTFDPAPAIRKLAGVKFNYFIEGNTLYFFGGGHSFQLFKEQLPFVQFLCNVSPLEAISTDQFIHPVTKYSANNDQYSLIDQKNRDLLANLFERELIIY